MSADAWNQLVDRFDVDALARQLASAGASYCFLTIGQGSGHCCAPNDTYDRISGINPSKCSRRNLITDLSDALRPLGIAMMAYVPADGSWADHEARKGLGLTKHWSDGKPYTWPEYRLPAFHINWEDICREWSVRFGTKVQGWWVDGSYHKNERYPDNEPPNLRTYAEALKAGNPDAIIAFNSGANALVVAYSQYEEFTSGEMIGNLPVGEAGFYRNFVQDKLPEADYGPIRRFIDGEQYHMLNFLGQEWGKGTPRLPTELAAGYTRYVTDHDAVITWDVPIEANGHIHEPVIRQLRAIGKATGTLIAGALLMTAPSALAADAVHKSESGVPTAKVADALNQVDLRKVKVGGEIGRRMDLTINGWHGHHGRGGARRMLERPTVRGRQLRRDLFHRIPVVPLRQPFASARHGKLGRPD